MPTIKVTIPTNAWTKEEKAGIVARLTDGMATAAQDAGKGDIKQYVNVQIEEAAEGGYAMGGQIVG